MTTDDDATESYWNEDDEADLAYWSKYWCKDENKLRQRKASIIEFRRASARRLRAALAEEPPQPIPLPPRCERKTPEQQKQEEEQFASFVTWGLAGCAGLVLAVCLLNQPSPELQRATHEWKARALFREAQRLERLIEKYGPAEEYGDDLEQRWP